MVISNQAAQQIQAKPLNHFPPWPHLQIIVLSKRHFGKLPSAAIVLMTGAAAAAAHTSRTDEDIDDDTIIHQSIERETPTSDNNLFHLNTSASIDRSEQAGPWQIDGRVIVTMI